MYRFNRLFASCVQPTAVRAQRPQQWVVLARDAARTTDVMRPALATSADPRSDKAPALAAQA